MHALIELLYIRTPHFVDMALDSEFMDKGQIVPDTSFAASPSPFGTEPVASYCMTGEAASVGVVAEKKRVLHV